MSKFLTSSISDHSAILVSMGGNKYYGLDVGKNLQFNFCNYLILVFLYRKRYFRFS